MSKKVLQKKTRISVPLKKEVYEMLLQMSEEQGFSMSSIASQMISSVLHTQKKMYEAINEIMADPIKLAEVQKYLQMSRDDD